MMILVAVDDLFCSAEVEVMITSECIETRICNMVRRWACPPRIIATVLIMITLRIHIVHWSLTLGHNVFLFLRHTPVHITLFHEERSNGQRGKFGGSGHYDEMGVYEDNLIFRMLELFANLPSHFRISIKWLHSKEFRYLHGVN